MCFFSQKATFLFLKHTDIKHRNTDVFTVSEFAHFCIRCAAKSRGICSSSWRAALICALRSGSRKASPIVKRSWKTERVNDLHWSRITHTFWRSSGAASAHLLLGWSCNGWIKGHVLHTVIFKQLHGCAAERMKRKLFPESGEQMEKNWSTTAIKAHNTQPPWWTLIKWKTKLWVRINNIFYVFSAMRKHHSS